MCEVLIEIEIRVSVEMFVFELEEFVALFMDWNCVCLGDVVFVLGGSSVMFFLFFDKKGCVSVWVGSVKLIVLMEWVGLVELVLIVV